MSATDRIRADIVRVQQPGFESSNVALPIAEAEALLDLADAARDLLLGCQFPHISHNSTGGGDIREEPCGECGECRANAALARLDGEDGP